MEDINKKFVERCFYNVSFSPEKRAELIISNYNNTKQKIENILETYKDNKKQASIIETTKQHLNSKLKSLYLDYLNAQARCASSFVVGPARFDVQKHNKRNESMLKKFDALVKFEENINKIIAKRMNKVFTATEKTQQELEIRKKDLQNLEKFHEMMKKANVAIKNNCGIKELVELGFPAKQAEEILRPNFYGKKGFESFELTNNLAKIKTAQKRIDVLEKKLLKKEEIKEKETVLKGLTVIENFELDRLQLDFSTKPEEKIRNVLKKHGFRWSSKNSVWQRKLTQNAIFSLKKYVLQSEEFKSFLIKK